MAKRTKPVGMATQSRRGDWPDWWKSALPGTQIAHLVRISTNSTSRKWCMPREAAPLRRGWPVGAFHSPPGTRRTPRQGRGLLQEPCPRAAAVVAVRKDLLQSSRAGAAEPWQPFELTVGKLLGSTLQTDRLP